MTKNNWNKKYSKRKSQTKQIKRLDRSLQQSIFGMTFWRPKKNQTTKSSHVLTVISESSAKWRRTPFKLVRNAPKEMLSVLSGSKRPIKMKMINLIDISFSWCCVTRYFAKRLIEMWTRMRDLIQINRKQMNTEEREKTCKHLTIHNIKKENFELRRKK